MTYNDNLSSVVGTPNQETELQKLTNRIDRQNAEFGSLLDWLYQIGGRLSENIPQPEDQSKALGEQMPFNEGSLMQLNSKVNQYGKLLGELETQIRKIGVLV